MDFAYTTDHAENTDLTRHGCATRTSQAIALNLPQNLSRQNFKQVVLVISPERAAYRVEVLSFFERGQFAGIS